MMTNASEANVAILNLAECSSLSGCCQLMVFEFKKKDSYLSYSLKGAFQDVANWWSSNYYEISHHIPHHDQTPCYGNHYLDKYIT